MNNRKRILSVIRYLLLFVILGLGFYGIMYFFESRPVEVYEAPLAPVTLSKAERRDIGTTLELTGYIEPEDIIPVVPFVNGTIQDYYITEGDYVEKDQVLATIDPQPYELQRLQAEAQYLALESSLMRVENLYKAGAAPLQDLEVLRAQRDAAKAQLELAELQLGYATVKAPVSGSVIAAPGAKGSIGATGQPIAVLTDLDELAVNVKISEKYYQRIKDNLDDLEVHIQTIDGEKSARCKVEYISPIVDAKSKNFTLHVTLLDNVESFAPGMYVKVFVTYEMNEDVLVLDQKLRKLDGAVYYYDENDSSVHYLKFEPGFENDLYFEVPEEYADYLFVRDGLNLVFDGQEVRVVEED